MEWSFIDGRGRGHRRAFGVTDTSEVYSICGKVITHLLARPRREWTDRGGELCTQCQ